MKKLIIAASFLLCGLCSTAQIRWSKIFSYNEYLGLKSDSVLVPPADTLASAPIGSLCIKNNHVYQKQSTGAWTQVDGGGNAVQSLTGTQSIQYGAFSSMPTPGTPGRYYAAADSAFWMIDNGVVWIKLGGGGGGSGGSFVANSGGAKFLGSGTYASKPVASAGPGFYYATDSLKMAYSDGSAWTFITINPNQTFGLHVNSYGATGDTLLTTFNDSIIKQPKVRDSVVAGQYVRHKINADSSWTLYNLPIVGNAGSSKSISAGTLGSRPAASNCQCYYFSTSDSTWAYDNGAWIPVKGGTGGSTSFANPSATIGLSAINGSASTAMRSDAAPPLSQAITPHWTAQHIFDLLPTLPVVNANAFLMGDSVSNGIVPGFRKLVVKDLPKTSTYPAYSTYGNFYSSSTFYSTDFVPVADALVSSMVAGQPVFNSTTGAAYSNYVRVRTLYGTNQRHKSDTASLKILNNTGSFMGFGFRSNNPASADFSDVGYIAIDASGVGSFTMTQGNGGSIGFTGSGSGITTHVGDVINIIRTINDTVLTYKAMDITTGTSSGTLTVTYTVGGSVKTPNTGSLAVWPFTQTSSFQLVNLSSSSSDTTNPNIEIIADSKGYYFANGFATSWPHTLQNTYGGTSFYVGGGDRLTDVLTRKWEILKSNPQNLIIEVGCNGLRFGQSVAQVVADAKTILSWFANSSTKVWFILPPEDSTAGGIGLAGLHAAFVANIPGNYISTVFTSMSTSNMIKSAYKNADGVHLSQVGNDTLANILKATGFFSTLDPSRASQYQTAGPGVQPIGNRVGLEWSTARSPNAVDHFDADGNFVPGLIIDNGAKVVITQNQNTAPAPPTGTLLQIDGGIGATGTSGALLTQDRNDPGNVNNSGGFYENSHVLIFSHQAADVGYVNNVGQFQWGAGGGGFNGIFQIRKAAITPMNTDGGMRGINFNSDSTTITMPGTTIQFASTNDLKGAVYTAASPQQANKTAVLHVEKSNHAGTNYTLPDDVSARFDGTVTVGELGGVLKLHTPPTGSASDSVAVWSHSDSTIKMVAQSSIGGGSGIVGSADLTAQTTAASNFVTYTPASTGTFRVGAYMDVTANSGYSVVVSVSWNDENGTGRAYTFITGTTSATGFTPGNEIEIRAGTAGNISMNVTLIGAGSVTYDVGGTIQKLR